jgi:hypothetical protein
VPAGQSSATAQVSPAERHASEYETSQPLWWADTPQSPAGHSSSLRHLAVTQRDCLSPSGSAFAHTQTEAVPSESGLHSESSAQLYTQPQYVPT